MAFGRGMEEAFSHKLLRMLVHLPIFSAKLIAATVLVFAIVVGAIVCFPVTLVLLLLGMAVYLKRKS